jgi:hypothetical protein
MTFDPTVFESLEAREKALAREADKAQIDAKIAVDWIDIIGALDAMYGNIKKPTDIEVTTAQQEESREPDPDTVLTQFDGAENEVWKSDANVVLADFERTEEDTWEDTIIWSNGEGKWEEDQKAEGNNEEDQRQREEEHPMTPSIRHLRKSGKINTQEQEDELIEHFSNGGSIDDIGTLETIREVQNLQELKDLLWDMTSNEEKTEQNIADFSETFGDELGIEKNKEWEYVNQTDEDALNMIGTHFNTIETGDQVLDTKNALDTAFASAHNNLIDGKQFPRDLTFQENSKKVLNGNISIQERFQAFKTIMLHVETHQALWGKKDERATQKWAEEKLEVAWIEEDFYTTLAEFQKEHEESPRQLELAQKLETLRVEAKLTEWEASLLVGWELDKVSESLLGDTI